MLNYKTKLLVTYNNLGITFQSQNNENLDIPAQEPMLENRLEHNNYVS